MVAELKWLTHAQDSSVGEDTCAILLDFANLNKSHWMEWEETLLSFETRFTESVLQNLYLRAINKCVFASSDRKSELFGLVSRQPTSWAPISGIHDDLRISGLGLGYNLVRVHRSNRVDPDLYKKLVSFQLLETDWDGFGASPITNFVIERSLDVVTQVQALVLGLPSPFVAPSADGSVLLKWSFAKENSIEAFVDDESITVIIENGADLHDIELSDPEQLSRIISRHMSRLSPTV